MTTGRINQITTRFIISQLDCKIDSREAIDSFILKLTFFRRLTLIRKESYDQQIILPHRVV